MFRRKEDISPLSQREQRLAYKTVQSGGDVPLHGLRKPAPERPKGKFLKPSQFHFIFFFLNLFLSYSRVLKIIIIITTVFSVNTFSILFYVGVD